MESTLSWFCSAENHAQPSDLIQRRLENEPESGQGEREREAALPAQAQVAAWVWATRVRGLLWQAGPHTIADRPVTVPTGRAKMNRRVILFYYFLEAVFDEFCLI